MARDLTKIAIGSRRVFFKGIDMGHTLGGVVVKVDRKFKELYVDQYGETPVDMALTGTKATIKCMFAQPDFQAWRTAVPESSEYDGTGSLDRVNFGADAGALLRGDAGLLLLHDPSKPNLADDSNDYTFYKCVSTEPVEITFKNDEQQLVEITFTALVDESYDSGRRLGHFGVAAVS